MGGPTGLDYAGAIAHLRLQGLRGKRLARLWRMVQACEAGALQGMAARREREQAQQQQAGPT